MPQLSFLFNLLNLLELKSPLFFFLPFLAQKPPDLLKAYFC